VRKPDTCCEKVAGLRTLPANRDRANQRVAANWTIPILLSLAGLVVGFGLAWGVVVLAT
jgi:hypothetical protein